MDVVEKSPLLILDALGPFMEGVDRHRINWSKIDFSALEEGEDGPSAERVERIAQRLDRYSQRVRADGATALSLDDLAHLYLCPWYGEATRRRVEGWRNAYRTWFDVIRSQGLGVYINTDILFYNGELLRRPGRDPAKVADFLIQACATVLDEFPDIQGIFFRLGECDGQDVEGTFHSQLVVKTPIQANALLKRLLPVFESRGRLLILRTWTVGAHPIGDLIWRGKTLRAVIEGLEDRRNLVLSMKYGESDFFRYLRLNKHFFRTPLPKLVEFQTRREYEGCGEYPSFVGYDYEEYLRGLKEAQNLLGAHIWCQTGGWTAFRRLTYLQPEGVWNEINTFVTLRMVRDRIGVEEAIAAYVRERLPNAPLGDLIKLLRLSSEVVAEILYLDDFARQRIYFRRTRVPPQLMVYWDHVFVNHTLRKVLRCFVPDPEEKVRQAWAALEKIGQMRRLAAACGLPAEDLDFMRDTFRILVAAREYALLDFSPLRVETLLRLKREYKDAWRGRRIRYAIKLDFTPQRLRRARFQWFIDVFLRRKRKYRRMDRIVTIWLLGKLYPLLRLGFRSFLGGFASQKAMGIGTIFR